MNSHELEIFQKVARGEMSRAEAREALASLAAGPPQPPAPAGGAEEEERVRRQLAEVIGRYLHLTDEELDPGASFKDLGIDSINGVEIIRDINTAFGLSLDAVVLYEYPTLAQLAPHVAAEVRRARAAGAVVTAGGSAAAPARARAASAAPSEAAPPASPAPPAPAAPAIPSPAAPSSRVSRPALPRQAGDILAEVVRILSAMLHMQPDELDPEASFKDLGIDSINGVEIVRELNLTFGLNMDAVVLYEHPSAAQLAAHIAGLRPGPAARHQSETQAPAASPERAARRLTLKPRGGPAAAPAPACGSPGTRQPSPAPEEEIAIIGMSGRYPGAETVEKLWANLAAGVESITEIPADRWDVDAYYDPEPGRPGKTYSRHGGFLTDVDKFDPMFFHISPKEAEFMDPQQRLFLEEVWKAVEDAGYAAASLSGVRCGVFVGATHGDYRQLLARAGLDNAGYAFTGLNPFILSGRVSYVLNLTGPNVTIDTACSSSLVAIHEACQAIRSGECDMAIAGGVRLILAPDLHIQCSQMELLSASGQCRALDQDADGLVLGEGVGVVVLKPLSRALRDRDHIYGVIKGSAVNHDGRSNGLTAPSVQAQVRLQEEVYRRFGIDPAEISYIEANGTGTPLGDAIELKALTEFFGAHTPRRQFCALGSLKSNIGHTTMASGVGGVIKLLLAFRHRQLPPTLHFRRAGAALDESPFYVNTELREWAVPDGSRRMAAISSFGLGGTNCHMVLAEAPPQPSREQPGRPFYLLPLSARTEEALRQKLADLADWLERGGSSQSLGDMAFTLSLGRSHFPVRAAFVVRDSAELRQALADALAGRSGDGCLSGDPAGRSRPDPLYQELARRLVDELDGTHDPEALREKLVHLAALYGKGCDLDWARLVGGDDCRRIPMPTYPFARVRCWVPEPEVKAPAAAAGGLLHPLVHRNTSTLQEQRYTSTFTGDEFFLADHRVDGQKVLPGVALMEMARSAGELATGARVEALRNLLWPNPVVVEGGSREVHVAVYPAGEAVEVEIYSEAEGQRVVHGQGSAVPEGSQPAAELPPPLDLAQIRQRCAAEVPGEAYYARFQGGGLLLGASFRSIERLWLGRGEALAQLRMPPSLRSTLSAYALHPSLADGAVETVISLVRQDGNATYMPLALGELRFFASIPEACWAYAVVREQHPAADLQKFDVYLLDDEGRPLVSFRELAVRRAGAAATAGAPGAAGAEGAAPEPAGSAPLHDLLQRLGRGELTAAEVEQFLRVQLP